MRDVNPRRYYGVALSLVGVTATGWLAATHRLALYIHPRYVVFTAVMGVIAGVLTLAGFAYLPKVDAHDHGERVISPRRLRLGAASALALLALSAIVLLVAPPSTLSVATAEQREVNQTLGSTSMTSGSASTVSGSDFAHFRLRDWADAIQLAAKPSVLTGRPFDETGFVSPGPKSRPDLFYVARFVLTCCAVDAQPVGVLVYEPAWRTHHKPGAWVHVKGALGADPRDADTSVVIPTAVEATHVPASPYEH